MIIVLPRLAARTDNAFRALSEMARELSDDNRNLAATQERQDLVKELFDQPLESGETVLASIMRVTANLSTQQAGVLSNILSRFSWIVDSKIHGDVRASARADIIAALRHSTNIKVTSYDDNLSYLPDDSRMPIPFTVTVSTDSGDIDFELKVGSRDASWSKDTIEPYKLKQELTPLAHAINAVNLVLKLTDAAQEIGLRDDPVDTEMAQLLIDKGVVEQIWTKFISPAVLQAHKDALKGE